MTVDYILLGQALGKVDTIESLARMQARALEDGNWAAAEVYHGEIVTAATEARQYLEKSVGLNHPSRDALIFRSLNEPKGI